MVTPYDGFGSGEGEDATTASLAAALGLTEQPSLGDATSDGIERRGGGDASMLSGKELLQDGDGDRGAAAAATGGVSAAGRRQPPPSGLLPDDAAADVYRYRLDAASLPSHDGAGGGRPLSASAASAVATLGGEAGDWNAGIYRATAAGAQPHAVPAAVVTGEPVGDSGRGAPFAVLAVADSDDDADMDKPLALRMSSASASAMGAAAVAAARRRRHGGVVPGTVASSSANVLSSWGRPDVVVAPAAGSGLTGRRYSSSASDGGGLRESDGKTVLSASPEVIPSGGAGSMLGGGAAMAGADKERRSSVLSTAPVGLAPVGADVAALSSSLEAQLAAAAVAASRRVPHAGAGVVDGLDEQVHDHDGGGHLDGSGMNLSAGDRAHHGDTEGDNDGEEADVDVEDDADEEMSGVCAGGNNAGEESTSSRTPLSTAAGMSVDTGAGEASVSTATTAVAGGGALAGAPKKKQVRARVGDLSPDMIHRCPFDGCSKKFAKKYNLKIHVRRHTGELPFACGLVTCGKRFMWHSSFLRHQRSHEKRSKGRVKEHSLPGREAGRGDDGGGDNARVLISGHPQLSVLDGLAGAPLGGMDAGRPSGSSPSPMPLPAYDSGGYGGGEPRAVAGEAAGGNSLFTSLHSLNILNCLSGGAGSGGGGGSRLGGGGGGGRLGGGTAVPAELAGLGVTDGFPSLTNLLDGGAGAGMGPAGPPVPPLPTGVAGALGMPVTLCMSPRQAASSAMAGAGVPNYFDPAITTGGSHGGGSGEAVGGGAAAHGYGGGDSIRFSASSGLSQHRFRDLHSSSHLPPAVADHGLPPSGRLGRPPLGPTMVSLLTDQPVPGFGLGGGPTPPPKGADAPASSAAAADTVAAAAAAAAAVTGAAASAMGHTGLDDACFSPVSGTTGLGGVQATGSVQLDEDSGCGVAGSGIGCVGSGKEDGRHGPAGDGSGVGGGGGGGSGGSGGGGGGGGGGGSGDGCANASSPESAADGGLADPYPDGREACVLSPPAAVKRNPWTSDDLCHDDSFHGDFDAAFDFFTH
ncbi:hypothetical protein MMPV_007820 [Pyropia vietnamensis]